MHEQSVNISEPRIAHQTSIPLLTPAPQSDVESSILNRDDRENQQSVDREAIRTRHYFEVSDDVVPPVATPPIGRWDVIAWEESQEQSLQGNRNARNVSLMNGLAQGASLPSPTLSPTLGMPPAELRARRRVSESAQSEVSEQQSRTDHSSGTSQQLSQLQAFQDERLQSFNSTDSVSQPKESPTVVQSVPNLASMVTSFENMDPKMQTYLLYQLLRRSTKETIKTVTQICDPALRVDFVRLLPQELRINIIQYLDVKTLCRAAQVSKHWRHIIDTAEHLWKRAITADGMHVSEDELWRAIREGWGWQSPYGPNAAEDDLNQIQHSAIDSPEVPTYDGERTHQIVTRAMRGNRRAVQRTATRSRRQPKKIIGVRQDRVPGYQNVRDSPQAARNLAESLVVPDPGRLPSLQDLHLYKSLYRRHHQLRRSWFDTQVKPLHLAFKAHSTKVVTCLQFDSDKIVSGSDDHLINVYDTQTGALRNSLVGHEGGVWAFQYIGKVLVSGSTDRTVRLWDLDRGVCTHILEGHTSTVRCLQVVDPVQVGTDANGAPIMMPPERLIISGSRDSSLRIWKFPVDGDAPIPPGGIIRGEPAVAAYHRRVLAGHHHSVRALDAYGDRMVSGSYDTSVCVWRISTGERLHRLNGHMNKVYSVVLDHKRDRCISGAMDSSIKIWSLETGGVLHNLEGHSSLVGLLSLDHGCLVSAAADSTLRIWDPETGQCRSTLAGHTGAITCFQHDTRKVISGSDKNLKVWDITTGRVVSNILTDLTGVWQCKFNERRCVAAVSRHGHTYIEVVDFGAVRDGVPADKRGRRVVVNRLGQEIPETIDAVEPNDMDPMVFHAMANHAAEDADDE